MMNRIGQLSGDTGFLDLRASVHLKWWMRPRSCDGTEATRNTGLSPRCHEQAPRL